MNYSRELLFFFSGLGVFNGLILSFYFLFLAKPRHISNYFLGGFLFSMCIRIGKSIFFYFNRYLAYEYLQFGLTGCLFIGPFLYFYCRAIIEPDSNIKRSWVYHMLVWVPAILVIGYLFPFRDHIDLWRGNGIIKGIYLVWLGYSILTGFVLRDLFRKFLKKGQKLRQQEKWVISLYIGNLLVWCAYYFSGYTSYILGALLFTFVLYLLIFLLFFSSKKDSILFDPRIHQEQATLEETIHFLNKLKQLIQEEELFKDPNLKVADVAKRLKVQPAYLSLVLNQHFGYGFPHFLNSFRVEESKRLLQSDHTKTFEALGYESGFNSKSTFFATFKKFTGTTPSKFKEKMKSN